MESIEKYIIELIIEYVESKDIKEGLRIGLAAIEVGSAYTLNAWYDMTDEEREELAKEILEECRC